ncbi:MAG: hypothetical protein JXM71_05340, partial [Spirochaetales bacterium]|nr:hypothetical protein [Spirochaetales bacterium]
MKRTPGLQPFISTLIIATLALFCTLPVAAQVQAKPRLVVMRFTAGDAITEAEALQINELFESAIIKTTVFETIDRARALTIAAGADLPAEFTDLESALALANAAKAEFVIMGTITVAGQKTARKYTINPRLAAVDTGKEAFSTPVSFLEKDKIKLLGELAVRVATAARQRSDVSKAQIEAFMSMGDWDNAERFLEIFERSRSSDDGRKEAAALRRTVDRSIAEMRFVDARTALDLFLYEEARRAIAEAKRRDPDNDRYVELEKTIEAESARKTATDDAKVIAQIEDLIATDSWDSASALLSYLETRGSRDPRIGRNRELIANGVRARDLHVSAKADLEAGDYESSILAINAALSLFPDDVDFLRTKNAIVIAEQREAASRAKWELYFEELRHVDIWGLVLVHKAPKVDLYAGLEYPSMSYIVPSRTQDEWLEQTTSTSLGVSTWYQALLWRPERLPLSSVALDTVWLAGARAGVATREVRYDANQTVDLDEPAIPYAWSSSASFTAAELFGGVEAKLTILSFTLSFGLDAGTGLEYASFVSSVPYLAVERTRTDA